MQNRNLDEQINDFDGSLGLENDDSFIIENPEDLEKPMKEEVEYDTRSLR